jgi:hypothetical protein
METAAKAPSQAAKAPAPEAERKPAAAAPAAAAKAQPLYAPAESGLAAFQKASEKPWTPAYGGNGRLRTLSGGRIKLPGQSAREMADSFLQTYAQSLLGAQPNQLHYSQTINTDREKVIYDETVDGVRVYQGSLSLIFENGELIRVQDDFKPADSVESDHVAIADVKNFVENGQNLLTPAPPGHATMIDSPAPELVYVETQGKLQPAYIVYVDVQGGEGRDRLRVLVDARSPRIISSHSVLIK